MVPVKLIEMIEIKFRGLNHEGKWIYGDLIRKLSRKGGQFHYIYVDAEDEESEGFYYTVDASTVGQFTGLIDKNGKEIYKGDIIMVEDLSGNPFDGWKDGKYTIIFETCAFILDKVGENDGMELFQEGCEFEVIGNIHTDKDLLK